MSTMKAISRREFLKRAVLFGAGAVTWSAFPGISQAIGGSDTKLLMVNLNGGLDGLYAFQPNVGDLYSTLRSIRPQLGTAGSSLLDTGSGYGFHPALTTFKSLFDSSELSVVMGVGYENMSRSHLDSEVVMARGVPDRLSASSSGFLNRLGAANHWNNFHAISVTGTDLAFEGGDYRGLQVRSLQDFYFRGFSSWTEQNHLVASSYEFAGDNSTESDHTMLADFARNFMVAADSTDTIKAAVADFSTPTQYPSTRFGRALKDIDVLFSTPNLNTQVGYMRVSGFDTHSNQQPLLDNLLLELNEALTAFISNMRSKHLWSKLIVMVFSEFGRTNRENGSGGTDHGGANPFFLMGGPVRGRTIHGRLRSADLLEGGWLEMQYNVVEVYRRTIARLGLDPDAVFAASSGPTLDALFR